MGNKTWIQERIDFLEKKAEIRESNLSRGQRSYFYRVFERDVQWNVTGHWKGEDFPTAMDAPIRQRKGEALPKLRGALTDLALMAQTTAPSYRPEGQNPWFDMDDARYVLDKYLLCEVLEYAMRHFGPEYADEFLNTLGAYYAQKGEEIIIQRKIGSFHPGI